MNHQTAHVPPEAFARDGELLKSTLRRLQEELDPGNPAPDLGFARTMVGSLIDLASANDDILLPERDDLYRAGRKHLILQALLRNAGNVCTKNELADLCRVSTNSTRVIKVYVCQIRAQLADHGLTDVIETVWGIGYRVRPRDARDIRRLIRQESSAAAAARADTPLKEFSEGGAMEKIQEPM